MTTVKAALRDARSLRSRAPQGPLPKRSLRSARELANERVTNRSLRSALVRDEPERVTNRSLRSALVRDEPERVTKGVRHLAIGGFHG